MKRDIVLENFSGNIRRQNYFGCYKPATSKKINLDILVGSLALFLAIIFCVNLWRCFSQDWIHDKTLRLEIVGLGCALLLNSACICIYVCKRGQQVPPGRRRFNYQIKNMPILRPNNSQIQLFIQNRPLPNYDSLMFNDHPPPYCSLFLENERLESQYCNLCQDTIKG